MSGKNANRYRCHYFLKVHKDSWSDSLILRQQIKKRKIERHDLKIASFQYLGRITIEPTGKETPI